MSSFTPYRLPAACDCALRRQFGRIRRIARERPFTRESPQMPTGCRSSGRRTTHAFHPVLENAGLAPAVRFPGPLGTPGPTGLFLSCVQGRLVVSVAVGLLFVSAADDREWLFDRCGLSTWRHRRQSHRPRIRRWRVPGLANRSPGYHRPASSIAKPQSTREKARYLRPGFSQSAGSASNGVKNALAFRSSIQKSGVAKLLCRD